jgi:hypothetical protein
MRAAQDAARAALAAIATGDSARYRA